MKKQLELIICLVAILIAGSATAQDDLKTFEEKNTKKDTRVLYIRSLNGKREKVKIIPDYANKVLSMIYLKDTITIPDFWGVPPEIRLLSKNFIEVRYEVRGGSNSGFGKTLILCVKGSKLYEAMHVLKHTDWDSGELRKHYDIKLALTVNHANNYKLRVNIHDKSQSDSHPKTNYTYSSQTVLSFDKKQNVFYSSKEHLHSDFTIITATGNCFKQKLSGSFPVIRLKNEIYYDINNRWYQLDNNTRLNEI